MGRKRKSMVTIAKLGCDNKSKFEWSIGMGCKRKSMVTITKLGDDNLGI
jgi:hypothetical protein